MPVHSVPEVTSQRGQMQGSSEDALPPILPPSKKRKCKRVGLGRKKVSKQRTQGSGVENKNAQMRLSDRSHLKHERLISIQHPVAKNLF